MTACYVFVVSDERTDRDSRHFIPADIYPSPPIEPADFGVNELAYELHARKMVIRQRLEMSNANWQPDPLSELRMPKRQESLRWATRSTVLYPDNYPESRPFIHVYHLGPADRFGTCSVDRHVIANSNRNPTSRDWGSFERHMEARKWGLPHDYEIDAP